MTGYELTLEARKKLHERIAAHEDQQFEERRQQSLRDAKNAQTRQEYLDGLEAQKAEKAKLADIELDKELAPQKQILMRNWLAAQPGKTSNDFEKMAWPHLRENLISERVESVRQATLTEGRRSGMYSF